MPAVINLYLAREKAKRILREERKPLLEEQDIKFQRALETGEDTTAIVAEKQRLRDITKLADNFIAPTEKEILDKLASLGCKE